MKNRYFAALALTGLVSFAACGGDEVEVVDEGVIIEDTMLAAPLPAPLPADSGAVVVDTGAVADTAL